MPNAKHEIRKKRLAILTQIDELTPKRCNQCKGSQTESKSLNCLCEASVEIRKLGNEINALVGERRSIGKEPERNSYDPKMVQLALDNNIGYKMFQQRVKKYKWSQYRAATEIPVRRMKDGN